MCVFWLWIVNFLWNLLLEVCDCFKVVVLVFVVGGVVVRNVCVVYEIYIIDMGEMKVFFFYW